MDLAQKVAHSRCPLTWLLVVQRAWRRLPHLPEGLSVCAGLFLYPWPKTAAGGELSSESQPSAMSCSVLGSQRVLDTV